MTSTMTRDERRRKRHRRIRKKVRGYPGCPRLYVHKTRKHIYAQLIDDFMNYTLTGASSLTPEIREEYSRGNREAAREVGRMIAELAEEFDVERVVFDRGGFPYHGRIAAVAEGAREGGLEF